MAPLQRRTDLSLQGTVAVIILVIMFLSGILCTVIFVKICSKQRKRERAMRRMQEENAPFVVAQYTAPPGAPSNTSSPPYGGQEQVSTELHNEPRYQYNGPLELQGNERPEALPAQQLDGYTAAPTFGNGSPAELPANTMSSVVNGKAQSDEDHSLAVENQQHKTTGLTRMYAMFK